MSFFVEPTETQKPKTKNVRIVSLLLAVILALMASAQLFTFERFPGVIADMWVPGNAAESALLAAILPILEVAALPFLLMMRLSIAMRVISMVAGWIVIVFWLLLMIWQNTTVGIIGNSGLLGATVKLPVGWWGVFFVVSLAVLLVWTSWGLWPLGRSRIR